MKHQPAKVGPGSAGRRRLAGTLVSNSEGDPAGGDDQAASLAVVQHLALAVGRPGLVRAAARRFVTKQLQQLVIPVDIGQRTLGGRVPQEHATARVEHDRAIVDRHDHRAQLGHPDRIGGDVAVIPDPTVEAIFTEHRRAVPVEDPPVAQQDVVPATFRGAGVERFDPVDKRSGVDHLFADFGEHRGLGCERRGIGRQAPDLEEATVREQDPAVRVDDDDAVDRGLALGGQERLLEANRLEQPALLADVPGDRRRADDAAGCVGDRRDHQRHGEPLAVLADPFGLERLDPDTLADPLEDAVDLPAMVGRREAVDGGSHDLFGGVAVHLLGAVVPTEDRAVEGLGEDGVTGRVDDRRKEPFPLPLQRRALTAGSGGRLVDGLDDRAQVDLSYRGSSDRSRGRRPICHLAVRLPPRIDPSGRPDGFGMTLQGSPGAQDRGHETPL